MSRNLEGERMNKVARLELVSELQGRHEAIVDRWYRSIVTTCYVPLSSTDVRQHLAEMTEQAIHLLVTEPFDPIPAQEIGTRMAALHCIQPEAIGRTLGVLCQGLTEGLETGPLAAVMPRIALLAEGIASGFFQRAWRTILDEQSAIGKALAAELQASELALREARDQLEERVAHRTEQLARSNEELRVEIGERRQAEAALRESEERWRLLVENAPALVLTLDREGTISYVNRPVEGVVGLSGLDFVVAEHREILAAAVRSVIDTGVDTLAEFAAVRRSGKLTWYSAHFGPIRRDGQVTAVLVIAWDITERRQIEEMKDNLIRDVSHELRTPLAKMQMSLELMLEILDEEEIDRQQLAGLGKGTYHNVERLLQTVEAILDLSSLEAGVESYRKETIQPGELIQEAILDMQPLAKAKGLILLSSVPPGLPAVRGDQGHLFRVLVNLIDNAIKFSEQGEIVVSCQLRGQEVELSVHDQGQGILPENIDQIFDRFFQEENRFRGVGVGLTICKMIVEAHEGKIWAESPGRGQGTTVRFTLGAFRHGSTRGDWGDLT
jgi:PAS domain S-box-containing protein